MPLYVASLRPIVKKQNGDYILKWYDCEYRWFLLISCNVHQQKQSSDKQTNLQHHSEQTCELFFPDITAF